jgi:Na+(H+)/acetate symporter ActP
MPFNQPGIVTIPLAFLVLIVVSLFTRHSGRRHRPTEVAEAAATPG